MAGAVNKDKALLQRIGFRIYRLRRRKGLTIQVLAEQVKVHANTIDNVEKGLGISVTTLCRIAAALDVSMDVLVPNSQDIVGLLDTEDLDSKKAAKVVCGTESLFPCPTRSGCPTQSGRNKSKSKIVRR